MISQEDIDAFENMFGDEKVEKIKEIVSEGYVRSHTSNYSYAYTLNMNEMTKNTEIIETLKKYLGL